MTRKIPTDEVFENLLQIPMIDVHTHLVNGRLGARGLHDILLYHMAVSELYAAGCPSGARLTQYPGSPTKEEAHFRIKEALPYLQYVKNTGISWGIRTILKDLYQWNEPVTPENWEKLDALIRERADDSAWQREILKRSGIQKTCTELVRREQGKDDEIMKFALEWIFVARVQWGEYDTAIYELERSWGNLPGAPTPIGGGKRPVPQKTIKTLSDVHDAVDYYVSVIPYDQIVATATHISTDIELTLVTDNQMEEALKCRDHAGVRERDIYASYIHEAILNKLEKNGKRLIYQFSYGAEPLEYETSSRLSQRSIGQVAEMLSRHPGIQFQCFLSNLHANQSMCTLAREIPNLTLTGIWWHNFFPSIIRPVIEQRLDMLPVNKQIGFFSDAYVVEWSYAKAVILRRQMAEVLASKINQGQYSLQDALDIYQAIVYETPKKIFNI